MIQDVYVRRAVFSHSLHQQLRRSGRNMDKVLENNERIPVAMMQKATDDAMKATFSYMPKFNESQNISGIANSAGYALIRLADIIGPIVPVIGTADNAYPRFFVNALSFYLSHSPLSVVDGTVNIMRGLTSKSADDILKAQKKLKINPEDVKAIALLNDGREKIAKTAVGMALFYASFRYALENQDLEPQYVRNSSGFKSSVRKFYPLAPYREGGDLAAKYVLGTLSWDNINWKETITNMTGTRLRSPISFTALEDLAELITSAVSSEDNKPLVTDARLGQMIGDWIDRVFGLSIAGLRGVSDMLATFDMEEAVKRDKNQIPIGEEPGFLPALEGTILRGLLYRLPFFKQMLPEKKDGLTSARQMRKSYTIFGTDTLYRTNAVAAEMYMLGLDKAKEKYGNILPIMKDKTAQAKVWGAMGPLSETMAIEHINTPYYKGLSIEDKRQSFINLFKEIKKRGEASAKVQTAIEYAKTGKPDPFQRDKFISSPEKERREVNSIFMAMFNGKNVLEMQAIYKNIDVFKVANNYLKRVRSTIKAR